MRTSVWVWLLALPVSLALRSSPDSTCASICMDNPALDPNSIDSYTTNTTDLSCTDSAYNTTEAGQKFQACMNCMQTSSAVDRDADVTDLGAYLYNLRSTLAACLFNFPDSIETVSTPCQISFGCQPLGPALKLGIANVSGTANQYDYCSVNSSVFQSNNLVSCVQCFTSSSNQQYLGNFLVALEAGCRQQPSPGNKISISASPFTSSLISITDPSTATSAPVVSIPIAIPIYRSTGFIIGMVGLAVITLAIGFAVFLIRRRHKSRRSLPPSAHSRTSAIRNLNTDYNARYGSDSITAPMDKFRFQTKEKAMSQSSLEAADSLSYPITKQEKRLSTGLGLQGAPMGSAIPYPPTDTSAESRSGRAAETSPAYIAYRPGLQAASPLGKPILSSGSVTTNVWSDGTEAIMQQPMGRARARTIELRPINTSL